MESIMRFFVAALLLALGTTAQAGLWGSWEDLPSKFDRLDAYDDPPPTPQSRSYPRHDTGFSSRSFESGGVVITNGWSNGESFRCRTFESGGTIITRCD
jgi:hypothetical protein